MSARSIRRAAERRAKKLAAKAGLQVPTVSISAAAAEQPQFLTDTAVAGNAPVAAEAAVEPTTASTAPPPQPKPISEARLAANRENAQKSYGPVTAAGKSRSCLNAVKHSLTSRNVYFVTEEEGRRYAEHVSAYCTQLQPVGPMEIDLVHSIAEICWRLASVPGLEQSIVADAVARILDSRPPDSPPPSDPNYFVMEARRLREKELRNLNLQENRLARRREREVAELRQLQAERKANEEKALAEAAKAALFAAHCAMDNEPITIPRLGFDFSKDRFETYMRRLRPAQHEKLLQEALAEFGEEPKNREAAA